MNHKKPAKSDLELDLENLEYRLKIQEGWVEKTKEEIEIIKEKMNGEENGN